MTIDEAIEDFRRSAKQSRRIAERFPYSYDEFISRSTDDDQIADWLEDLKVYKKALEMACDILGDMDDSNSNNEEWNEWLLQKAREKL